MSFFCKCDVCEVSVPSLPTGDQHGTPMAPWTWLRVVVRVPSAAPDYTTLHACGEACARRLIAQRAENLTLINFPAAEYGEWEAHVALAIYERAEHGVLWGVKPCGDSDSLDWSLSTGKALGSSRYANACHASRLLVPTPKSVDSVVDRLYEPVMELVREGKMDVDSNELPLAKIGLVVEAWGGEWALAEFAYLADPTDRPVRSGEKWLWRSVEYVWRRDVYVRRALGLLHAADEAIGEVAVKAISVDVVD